MSFKAALYPGLPGGARHGSRVINAVIGLSSRYSYSANRLSSAEKVTIGCDRLPIYPDQLAKIEERMFRFHLHHRISDRALVRLCQTGIS